MIRSNLIGCEFIVTNTDAQALSMASAPRKIQLGIGVTTRLGAGARPECRPRRRRRGDRRHSRSHCRVRTWCSSPPAWAVATGSGAAPVIARVARESGILTVGVVTKPFHFEGVHRMRIADAAIEDLQKYVDTLIIIPTRTCFRIANEPHDLCRRVQDGRRRAARRRAWGYRPDGHCRV